MPPTRKCHVSPLPLRPPTRRGHTHRHRRLPPDTPSSSAPWKFSASPRHHPPPLASSWPATPGRNRLVGNELASAVGDIEGGVERNRIPTDVEIVQSLCFGRSVAAADCLRRS